MRVCLASIHPRALSGQIEGLVGLAKELARLGQTVQLATAFGSEMATVDRLALAAGDEGALWGKITRIGGILAELVRRSREVDLIHLNLPTPAFAILGDLLQQLVQVPVVVGFEAHLAETRRVVQSGDLWASPRFYLPRLLVNNGLVARSSPHRCAGYLVSSPYQAAELRRLGFPPERIGVLPNLIDAEKLHRFERPDARRRLGLPAGRLVAYVGHYHHVKGVETLVEAFGLLRRCRPDGCLVLAWSGLGDQRPIDRAIERAGVTDRVLRLGRVDVGLILSAVDVLVLPYRYTMGQNAYPGLVLEAMAVGVPLVTSSLPLLRGLLEAGRAALLAPPGDAGAFARRIETLLADQALAIELVAEQLRQMAGPLNPKEVAKQYVRVYRQACSGEAALLQPASGEPGVRSPALWRAERGLGQPPGAEGGAIAVTARRKGA